MKHQFSLQRLFASFTLVAVGLPVIIWLGTYQFNIEPTLRDVLAALLFISSGMLIGAGALLPFRRAKLGIALGFVALSSLLGFAFYMALR